MVMKNRIKCQPKREVDDRKKKSPSKMWCSKILIFESWISIWILYKKSEVQFGIEKQKKSEWK